MKYLPICVPAFKVIEIENGLKWKVEKFKQIRTNGKFMSLIDVFVKGEVKWNRPVFAFLKKRVNDKCLY